MASVRPEVIVFPVSSPSAPYDADRPDYCRGHLADRYLESRRSTAVLNGPREDLYQSVGRFCIALAGKSGRKSFSVPSSPAGRLLGVGPRKVTATLAELVKHRIIRLASPGGPGKLARYRLETNRSSS